MRAGTAVRASSRSRPSPRWRSAPPRAPTTATPTAPAPAAPAGDDQGGPEDRLPAQAGEQPVLRHVRQQGRQGRGRGVQGRLQRDRPVRGQPVGAGQLHQHAVAAGDRRHRGVGQRQGRHLRRAQRGPPGRREGRHLRLRHQPDLPRPVHQPGHRRGHRRSPDQADLRGGRRRTAARSRSCRRRRTRPTRTPGSR